MDNSFYLKNGSVLWNGAFTPLDMAVEDGHITAPVSYTHLTLPTNREV